MGKNKKRFVLAAIVPGIILAGLLFYISPFSTNLDSGTTAKPIWNKNSGEAFAQGQGREKLSSPAERDITAQRGGGMAYAYPNESQDKINGETSFGGQGRGRSSSRGNGDATAQRGGGRHRASSGSGYGNRGLTSQQR